MQIKKILSVFVAGIVGLALFSAAFVLYLRSQATHPSDMLLEAPHGVVHVHFEGHGMPQIVSTRSDLDVFYAQGYVHAMDRLWEMEFHRRVAAGRLSEIFGKEALQKDQYLRTWGFYRAAKASVASLDQYSKAVLQAYADGVNAYIQQHARAELPLAFILLKIHPEPWTITDTLSWQKIMAWDLESYWKDQLINAEIANSLGISQIAVLHPPYPHTAPTILADVDCASLLKSSKPKSIAAQPRSEEKPESGPLSTLKNELLKLNESVRRSLGLSDSAGKGSNSWVISGKYTTSGQPLLANDPHLSIEAPMLWYLLELKGPRIHVVGASIPGIVGVLIGHNAHIAWGLTNSNLNTQDLYLLPKNAAVEHRVEIIRVKGEKDQLWNVEVSRKGPVLSPILQKTPYSGVEAQRIAIHWSALMPGDTTVQSFLGINYAKNWSEFTEALKDFVSPPQNFIYADTQGNIGYYVPGKLPIRHWKDIELPAVDDGQHELQEYVPFEQMPHALNPRSGFIVTANNKIISDQYLYTLTFHWAPPPYRAERILDLFHFNEKTKVDMEKMRAVQLDVNNYLWRDFKSILLRTQPMDTPSRQALSLLQSWNGDMDLHSSAASVFAYWYREISKMSSPKLRVFEDQEEPLFIKSQLSSACVYCFIQGTLLSASAYQSQTLQSAMQKLIQEHGANPEHWQWRFVHRLEYKELGLGEVNYLAWIWNRSIETPGGAYTVNVGTYDAHFMQTKGPGYRQLIDLANFKKSLFIQAMGQSENPFSKNYSDLISMWQMGQYLPMSFL